MCSHFRTHKSHATADVLRVGIKGPQNSRMHADRRHSRKSKNESEERKQNKETK